MDMKESVLISCIVIFLIIGGFWGYSAYQNNITINKNYIQAQDAFRNGELKKAEKLLEGKPSNKIARDFYILKYNVFMNLNKQYQAEETCFLLLKKYPKDAFINYLLSLVYYNLGDIDKTEKYLKTAKDLEPQNIDYKINLANLYANTGKDEDAIKLFNELKEEIPGYEIAWATIATIYENKNDYTNALKYRKEAAEKFKTNAYDLYMLANLYQKLNRKEEAAEYFAKTAKIDINDNTDAKTRYFELTGKPYHSSKEFKNERIPFTLMNKLMIVNALINGHSGKFLVDTGATYSLIYSDFLKKNNIKLKTNMVGIMKNANGTMNITPLVNVNIKLGSNEYNNSRAFVLLNSDNGFDGIIGNDILEKTDYYIDRPNKVLVIRKYD